MSELFIPYLFELGLMVLKPEPPFTGRRALAETGIARVAWLPKPGNG